VIFFIIFPPRKLYILPIHFFNAFGKYQTLCRIFHLESKKSACWVQMLCPERHQKSDTIVTYFASIINIQLGSFSDFLNKNVFFQKISQGRFHVPRTSAGKIILYLSSTGLHRKSFFHL